jgi:hypothetical protein
LPIFFVKLKLLVCVGLHSVLIVLYDNIGLAGQFRVDAPAHKDLHAVGAG